MDFASRIIAWQRLYGRHGLPWQSTQDPYRIWLSEIMLQQTQVSTVIGYYHRFLERFPDIAALAAASQDEVMPYWAGLGYYARARNLHRCAVEVCTQWNGRFPPTACAIATLPGIGPSTAAAIAAFAYNERAPILDGNVKRVFTRHFGVEGDPTRREVEQRLWRIAHEQVDAATHSDALDMQAYTQGLMDLGATLCTRGKPACERCPVAASCIAKRDSRQAELPTRKVRQAVPERRTAMLVLHRERAVLLLRRPSPGIWGGLWSLPEFDADGDPRAAARLYGADAINTFAMAHFAHTFSHYRLHITPWHVEAGNLALRDGGIDEKWVVLEDLAAMALPAPIKKLLDGLFAGGLLG
jgi:A/G-specific adenine glycosylase